MKMFSVRLPEELIKKFRIYAIEKGIKVQKLIADFIEKAMKGEK